MENYLDNVLFLVTLGFGLLVAKIDENYSKNLPFPRFDNVLFLATLGVFDTKKMKIATVISCLKNQLFPRFKIETNTFSWFLIISFVFLVFHMF